MTRLPPFIRWLALAALADWLVTRTLARAAIFMPKSPHVQVAYQGVVLLGQAASVLAALLAIGGMGWLALQWSKSFRSLLSWGLIGLVVLSVLFLVSPPSPWLLLSNNLLLLGVVAGIVLRYRNVEKQTALWIATLPPALAILAGVLYHSIQTFYAVLHLPGPPPLTILIFNFGEALVLLAPLGLWGYFIQKRRMSASESMHLPTRFWRAIQSPYVIALIPALTFSILYLVNPAMAGILAIWSTGLTLYLPWIVYAVSLWLMVSVLLATRRHDDPLWVVILLLAAGGYAPQLSTQMFFGVIGLGLLSIHNCSGENPRTEVIGLAIRSQVMKTGL